MGPGQAEFPGDEEANRFLDRARPRAVGNLIERGLGTVRSTRLQITINPEKGDRPDMRYRKGNCWLVLAGDCWWCLAASTADAGRQARGTMQAAVDKAFEALKTYDWGQDHDVLKPIDDAVVATHGNAAARRTWNPAGRRVEDQRASRTPRITSAAS